MLKNASRAGLSQAQTKRLLKMSFGTTKPKAVMNNYWDISGCGIKGLWRKLDHEDDDCKIHSIDYLDPQRLLQVCGSQCPAAQHFFARLVRQWETDDNHRLHGRHETSESYSPRKRQERPHSGMDNQRIPNIVFGPTPVVHLLLRIYSCGHWTRMFTLFLSVHSVLLFRRSKWVEPHNQRCPFGVPRQIL